ncbi:MAG TPA: SAM-dependent methyltransferase, partial [Burkholderiales bacterium]
MVLRGNAPADQLLSRYFREHRSLGQNDRAFVAECVFAVLRRRRSLEAAAGSPDPQALVGAALLRVLGFSARALQGLVDEQLLARVRATEGATLPPAVRADLPDWLWERLVAQHGEEESQRIAQGLLNPAPLDLRVNLARTEREAAREKLAADGIESKATPYSPAGLRIGGKPAINRHPLFTEGLVEVQDEGSQLLAWLLAPRRGEMIADYCAGAGGKTLAMAMLMRGTGRIYAMDVSAKRLAALAPRAARAGITNIQTLMLGEDDARARRLADKLDRVLVDAPCSGFGTLRRNPDLKWRHPPAAIAELTTKQRSILDAAARL